MTVTLEKRLSELRRKTEGAHDKTEYEHVVGLSLEEKQRIIPLGGWRLRILSELDFCLQMKRYTDAKVTDAVEKALDILETAIARDGVLTNAICQCAEQALLPLKEEAHTYTLLMVGHAHLDMNWMWGWEETVATVIATFKTVLRLMEDYPQFCFSQSQASTYKIVEDYAPEMMPAIQQRIREGRWEVTATAWVETDKNMPCTESLLNHILCTKQYMKEHWDIDPVALQIDFSPDTFGHSANLPELDTLGDVRYYYHCRGLGDTDTILYRWQAPSGKELLAYKEPYWYNSSVTPVPGIGLPRVASLCGGLRTGIAVYGVGDHGGGPTRRDLDRILEMQDWPIFPRVKFAGLREYFATAEKIRHRLPVIKRELNAIFTGCYTTQSRIKKGNRRAEAALITSETLAALTARELGVTYAEKAYERAWQDTLFTHFHDILTGSCVQDSREHAMGLYQNVLATANTRAAESLTALAEAIDTSAIPVEEDTIFRLSEGAGVGYALPQSRIPTHENGIGLTRIFHIANPTGTYRHENATITVWDWPGKLELLKVTAADGAILPFERTPGVQTYWAHNFFTLSVTVNVPAYGYTTVVLQEGEPDESTQSHLFLCPADRLSAPPQDIMLENAYLCVKFDGRTGALYSLVDKETGHQRLRKGEVGGLCYIRAQRNPRSAWVIDRYLEVQPVTDLVQMTTIGGHMEPGVQTEHRIAGSRVISTITLGSEDRYLKIQLHITWQEQSRDTAEQPVLSYRLPLDGCYHRLLCDVPGGAQWHPEQELDVPGLRYGAAEMSDGRVLALASDCKYGYRLSREDLFITLINTAFHPDPYPEQGIQDVSLFIFSAPPDPAALARITDCCLYPLQYVANTAHPGRLPTTDSLLHIEGANAVVSGVARRDGQLAIRLYETAGRVCPITVTLHSPAESAALTDLFGRPLAVPVTVSECAVQLTLPAYSTAELRIK